MKTSVQTQSGASTGKKNGVPGKRSWFTRICRVISWSVAIILTVAIVLAFLVLAQKGTPRVSSDPSLEETMTLNRIILKLMRSMQPAKGKPVTAEATVTLNQEEVNALLATGIRIYQLKHSAGSDPVLFAEWLKNDASPEQSCLSGEVSLPIGMLNLAVNAKLKATPDFSDGKIHVNLLEASAGALSLPCWMLQGVVDDQLAALTESEDFKMVKLVLQKAKITRDGELEITFSPQAVSLLLGAGMRGGK